MHKPTIYIASKIKHAERWRQLRSDGFNIISSWIDADNVTDFNRLWEDCLTQAEMCDVLIVYCEPGETLKGAWVELGAALASDYCPDIFAVGIGEFTIANLKRIRHFDTIEAAFGAVE